MPMTILTEPDSRLRVLAEEVPGITPAIGAVIDKLVETMLSADGVGLAATQVGVNSRIIAVRVAPDDDGVFQTFAIINPVILAWGGDAMWGNEGCLSVPGIIVSRQRASEIEIKGLDREGVEVTFTAKGHAARVLQHEIDHLNGITILKAASSTKRKQYLRWQKKRQCAILNPYNPHL